MQKAGKLILIVGPSGSGKGTLVAYLRATFPEFVYATSTTTRAPREGEVHASGKKYEHVRVEEFERMIEGDAFLEWALYGGNYYGTPLEEVMHPLEAGKIILHELEVQGAEQLQEKLPKDTLVSIFVDAGSWETLKGRILARGAMNDVELAKREAHYYAEHDFKEKADFIIENGNGQLEGAKEKLKQIVNSLLSR